MFVFPNQIHTFPKPLPTTLTQTWPGLSRHEMTISKKRIMLADNKTIDRNYLSHSSYGVSVPWSKFSVWQWQLHKVCLYKNLGWFSLAVSRSFEMVILSLCLNPETIETNWCERHVFQSVAFREGVFSRFLIFSGVESLAKTIGRRCANLCSQIIRATLINSTTKRCSDLVAFRHSGALLVWPALIGELRPLEVKQFSFCSLPQD